MATQKKKEEQETQNRPDAAYSTEGLNSRTDVERALAGAQYTPSERVQEAGAALKQWQESRPADYQSRYQGKIDDLLGQLTTGEASGTTTRRIRFTASMRRPTPRMRPTPARTQRHRRLR